MIRPGFVDTLYIMGVLILSALGEDDKCEQHYSSRRKTSGTFSSPKFPKDYPELINCYYYFDASPDGRIQIEFTYFDLEDMAKDDVSCRFDYIDVFNVDHMGYKTLIDRYCGSEVPEPIISAQSRMEIIFVSDYTKTASGFLGHFEFLDDDWQPFGPPTTGCGTETLTGYGGIITSPSWPSPFPGMSKCTWLVRVKEGQQILIHILALDLGPTSQCKKKEIRIYNGFATPETLPVKTLCGQLAAYDQSNSKYLSSSSRIVIRFIAESENRDTGSTGFKLSWTSVRLPGSGSCDEFLCAGGRQCVQTICPSMPKYCINKSLRCDGVPNCGPYDDSDERKCPREILIMTACIALPSIAVISLIAVVIYCYRSKRVKKSLSQEQPLANQRQVSSDTMSPSRSQCMMHTSFIDGKPGGEEVGLPEKLDNGSMPIEGSFKTHQKRASYHMMKQTFDDNNFIIAEI